MKTFISAGLIAVVLCAIASAKEKTVQPRGEYAQIDTQRDMRAIAALKSGRGKEQAGAAQEVIANAGRYCPAVFFSLATYLFEQGKTDEAVFWMYAGRIRAWYDVKRCTDQTVEDAVAVLNQQLPDLLRLIQFEDLENAQKIVERAIEWDRKTPHDYDARWIALHGLGAFLPAKKGKPEPLTVPQAQWDALAEGNRKEYLANFSEDMAGIEPEQMQQIKAKIRELKKEAKQPAGP